jgi:DNA ligase D-like protein (predicted polymerase)
VSTPNGTTSRALVVADLAHVVWAVNMGCLGFHPWPYLAADPDHTDELRLDLDPQPGTDFTNVRDAARVVHALLDEVGVTGYPKTTGNRGLHVYVRLEPRWDSYQVRWAAVAIARELERRHPDIVTAAWWKEERGERVFIDYTQNARDRTIASAYSVRARADGTVSAPVTWKELPDVETEDFTIATMPGRFAELGDVQARIDDTVNDLRVLLEWVERDEQEGVAEAPYPPNFPKMPGEPKRVQPSRAKKDVKPT